MWGDYQSDRLPWEVKNAHEECEVWGIKALITFPLAPMANDNAFSGHGSIPHLPAKTNYSLLYDAQRKIYDAPTTH